MAKAAVLLPTWCARCGQNPCEDGTWYRGLFLCPRCKIYISRRPAHKRTRKEWVLGLCRICGKPKRILNGICYECRSSRVLPKAIVTSIQKLDPDLYGGLSAVEIRELLLRCPQLLERRPKSNFDLRKWRFNKVHRQVAANRMDPNYRCNTCAHQLPLEIEIRFLMGGDVLPSRYPCVSCPTSPEAGNQRWKNYEPRK